MHSNPSAGSCEEIVAQLRAALPGLRARYGVGALSVFGSRLRSTANSDSDLDLLVEFDRAPGFFKFIELEDHLSELLGLKVDLVMKTALRPRLGERIIAEAMAV
jgi:predicted nucleotidyltransferase